MPRPSALRLCRARRPSRDAAATGMERATSRARSRPQSTDAGAHPHGDESPPAHRPRYRPPRRRRRLRRRRCRPPSPRRSRPPCRRCKAARSPCAGSPRRSTRRASPTCSAPTSSIAGRIEPDNRRSGLLAVGSSFVSVTGAGFEQYEAIARNVAEQALDPAHRDALVPCDAAGRDRSRTTPAPSTFVRARRPPAAAPAAHRRRSWRRASASRATPPTALGDFYAGLEAALTTLLLSPEFLFRVEMAEPDPNDPDRQRLDSDASMASRLSYFLWNTTPDDELLAAAERGELVDDAGLAAQVDRLLGVAAPGRRRARLLRRPVRLRRDRATGWCARTRRCSRPSARR